MRIQLLLILIVGLLISGCGQLAKKAVLLNLGDDMEQVVSMMGVPGDRQFNGKHEAWQYCETDAGLTYDDYRIVWFYDGRVTGITSYKQSEFGLCSAFFKSIIWEDAPSQDHQPEKALPKKYAI